MRDSVSRAWLPREPFFNHDDAIARGAHSMSKAAGEVPFAEVLRVSGGVCAAVARGTLRAHDLEGSGAGQADRIRPLSFSRKCASSAAQGHHGYHRRRHGETSDEAIGGGSGRTEKNYSSRARRVWRVARGMAGRGVGSSQRVFICGTQAEQLGSSRFKGQLCRGGCSILTCEKQSASTACGGEQEHFSGDSSELCGFPAD
mmetsp:Transcript_13672/g.50949  ORF Transcript_13672/g.50949 Transcript_13672/m.50949 type:complete len:201 (-) Transcript_13672:444-1046(-)